MRHILMNTTSMMVSISMSELLHFYLDFAITKEILSDFFSFAGLLIIKTAKYNKMTHEEKAMNILNKPHKDTLYKINNFNESLKKGKI